VVFSDFRVFWMRWRLKNRATHTALAWKIFVPLRDFRFFSGFSSDPRKKPHFWTCVGMIRNFRNFQFCGRKCRDHATTWSISKSQKSGSCRECRKPRFWGENSGGQIFGYRKLFIKLKKRSYLRPFYQSYKNYNVYVG